MWSVKTPLQPLSDTYGTNSSALFPSLWGALPPLLGPDGDIVCHSLALPGFLGYHYATLHSGRTVLPQFDANFRARPPGRGGLRHGQAQLRGL